VKELKYGNKDSFFKSAVGVGDVFTADMEDFIGMDVRRLAAQDGVELHYFPPGSREYKLYGCSTWRVESKKPVRKVEIVLYPDMSTQNQLDILKRLGVQFRRYPKSILAQIFNKQFVKDMEDGYKDKKPTDVLLGLSLEQLRDMIDQKKADIAEIRNSLRDTVNDLQDFLETLDKGVDGLDAGLAELESAVDSLSEQV